MAISPATRAGLVAAICAGIMIAQQVAAKATRDALFLTTYGIAALPTMLIVSALISVAIIPIVGRALQRWGHPAWCHPCSPRAVRSCLANGC